MRRVAPLVLTLLLLPGSAHAATISVTESFVQQGKVGGYYFIQAEFVADAGERNVVTARQDGSAVIVRDEGAALRAGKGCTSVDDRTARCVPAQGGSFSTVWLKLGDADDRFDDAGLADTSAVDGGPGADVLQGGRGALDGGDGADRLVAGVAGTRLSGGLGRDELVGNVGRDLLEGDPPAGPFSSDVMDGGPGEDTVSYFRRKSGVRVDLLMPAGHGAEGENDEIRGAESIYGTDGADRLAGDDGANVLAGNAEGGGDVVLGRGGDDELHGSPSEDVLRGGGGDDLLLGHAGGDRLEGGEGDDRLGASAPADAARDRVRCSGGKDVVTETDLLDVVGADCERVFAWPFSLTPPRRSGGGYVVDAVEASSRPPCMVRLIVVRGRGARASRWLRRIDGRTLRIGIARRVARPPRVRPAPPGRLRLVVEARGCRPHRGNFLRQGFTVAPS